MQGIESLGPNVAEKLAAMGQFEDDQIAHVAEGEVIVPAPIMKYFPEVREQVFGAIRETGLEPEQFIVGGEMVAINPNTGIQEFGFLKKAFKKIKKFVKKAGPLLLAAALPYAAPSIFGAAGVLGGTVAKAATANALDTALKGGNLKDVAKAGVTGAAAGGIAQFGSNLVTNQTGGYLSGREYISPEFLPESEALPVVEQPTSTASSANKTSIGAKADKGLETLKRSQAGQPAPPPARPVTPGEQLAELGPTEQKLFNPQGMQTARVNPAPETSLALPQQGGVGQPYGDMVSVSDLKPLEPQLTGGIPSNAANSFVDRTMQEAMGGMPSGGIGDLAATTGGDLAATTAKEEAQKSLLQRAGNFAMDKVKEASLGDLVSTGAILYGLSGEADDPEEQDDGLMNRDEIAQMMGLEYSASGGTGQYGPAGLYYNPETGAYQDVPYVPNSGIVQAFAGGHIVGPGTGTSDSIPAYLSDGEFVMTAKAVEGAGDGDRKKGAAKMYAMMNKFEGMA